MGVQEKFSNPLIDFTINNIQDVEKAALRLRDAWELGLAPLSNILELLEENGIRVHEVQNIDDFDGLSARVGDFHVIVINKSPYLLTVSVLQRLTSWPIFFVNFQKITKKKNSVTPLQELSFCLKLSWKGN